jgi:two-component system, NarL family, response regulator LiaR
MKIKIAIIDDQDLFRDGLKLILSQIDNFEVIFDTSSGYEFIDFLQNNMPDIVLMDINMPQIDGIETTIKAISLIADLKIVALTLFSDLTSYTLMQNAGVKGFINKNIKKTDLQQAINQVYEGGYYFSPEIMKLLAFKSGSSIYNNKFTNREIEVLKLVCNGLTSHEISDKLFISIKTVEVHRTNIFGKAKVKNVAELIIWAIKNNYFTIE